MPQDKKQLKAKDVPPVVPEPEVVLVQSHFIEIKQFDDGTSVMTRVAKNISMFEVLGLLQATHTDVMRQYVGAAAPSVITQEGNDSVATKVTVFGAKPVIDKP